MIPYLAILQARMGSSRLPGKVMADLCSKPLIWHILTRLKLSKKVNEIVVAIPQGTKDDGLYAYLHSLGVKAFRGNENDVLNRFYQVTQQYPSQVIIRVTADNPLVDPKVLDETIEYFEKEKVHYARTSGFPLGIGAEVFTVSLLKEANENAMSAYEREHVTPYMYTTQKSCGVYNSKIDESHLRLTVDTEIDLTLMRKIYAHFFKGTHDFFLADVLAYLKKEGNPL